MGYQWFKRPIQVVSTGTSAISGSQTVAGTLTVTKTLTASSQATVTKTFTASSQSTLTKAVSISSAATVTKTLTGSSKFRSGAELKTSSGALTPGGVSVVRRRSSAGGSTQFYTLGAPSSGIRKTIVADNAGSSRKVRVTLTGGYTSSSGGTFTKLTFNQPGVAELVGLSTALYHIIASKGATLAA